MQDQALRYQALGARLANVRERIAVAAQESNRSASEITLVAIAKNHPVEALEEILTLGHREFGENRVQEAEKKIDTLGREAARWHLVGHLQGNKARKAVKLFDYIHSLDSTDLALRLDRLCVEEGRSELPVLIQVDLGGEEAKTGIAPNDLPNLLEVVAASERLRLIGLMTLPPYFENPECSRPFFKTLRELRGRLQQQGVFGDGRGELSMGMSHDFEIAIKEGATMVRVGTAIFGERT